MSEAKPWVHNTRRRPVLERFWEKVDRSGGPDACWPWTAGRNPDTGYGVFHPHGNSVLAHRFAYEAEVGPIPEGFVVDHTCHNDTTCGPGACEHRACENPRHLEAVANAVNVNRSRLSNARKTHCPRGHEYTPENTFVQVKKNTESRKCRECARAWDRARSGNRAAQRKEAA